MRSITCIICFACLLVTCKKEEASQPLVSNSAPVANAGQDDTIDINVSDYLLDGSASYDPDKDFIQFAWRHLSGPQLYFFQQNQNQTTATVSAQREGLYVFELQVTDRLGLSDKDTMNLIVIDNFAIGKTPVININCSPIFLPLPANSFEIYTTVYVENDQGKKLYLSEGISVKQIQGPSQAVIQQPYLDYIETIIPITGLIKGNYQFQIEVNRKGITSNDTATIHVIDDTLRGKDFIFESKWEALSDQVVYAKTAERPEIFYMAQFKKPEVFVLFENSTEWYNEDDLGLSVRFSLCYSTMEIQYNYEGYPNVVGKKVKIKVRYL